MSQSEDLTEQSVPAPGERLRQSREARKLTVASVAERLHLSVAKIEALERGETAGIAAPVFLAGYLRAYARMVELDPEEIIGEFQSLTGQVAVPSEPLAADVVKGYGKIRSELPAGFSLAGGKRWRSALRWGAVMLVLLAVAGVWWQIHGEPREAAPVEAEDSVQVPLAMQAPERETSGFTAEPMIDAPMETDTPPREPLAPRSQLVLTLVEDSWAEIIDAQGNRLMHELARAGETHALTGVAPFDIMLGYVPGVELQYNGAPYDLSRFQGRRTARFLVGATGDRLNID